MENKFCIALTSREPGKYCRADDYYDIDDVLDYVEESDLEAIIEIDTDDRGNVVVGRVYQGLTLKCIWRDHRADIRADEAHIRSYSTPSI